MAVKSASKSKKKAKRFKRWLNDIWIIIFAALIYSLGLHCFTAPNGIAPGGIIGLAIIVNSFTPVSVGVLYALFNVPLIILGVFSLGKRHMVKTLIAVAVITAATDWLFVRFPVYEGDKILAAVFGGVFFGCGLGLIYLRESTSGGIDILNRIINKKRPHLRMGVIMLAMDAVVIAAAMLVFGSIESGLYAIIAIFVSGRVVDIILYGRKEGKLLLVFSPEHEKITRKILTEEGRGVTFLKAVGAYSREDSNVICCAVQNNQYARIKRKIGEIDKSAFIVITNIREVLGNGFEANV
ncbi:MAG: YitT family protein [Oscillospiraceae bacterium]|nr:YitT family protein [Oscillospiraceae bacterium]